MGANNVWSTFLLILSPRIKIMGTNFRLFCAPNHVPPKTVKKSLFRANEILKVCIIKNCTKSGADNSASRHDSLNLKGSAESGEEND